MKDRFLLTLLLVAVLVSTTAGGLSAFILLQAPEPTDEPGVDDAQERPDEDTGPNMFPNARFSWRPLDPRSGEEVTFDASASTDPDGSVTLFRWTFGDGPPVRARGPLVFRTFQDAGIKHIRLTVFDNREATGFMEAAISVRTLLSQETLFSSYAGNWEEPDAFLIKNETRWDEVWNVLQSWRSPTPPLPQVDFTKETVVLAASGWRPSLGYGLQIHEVLFDGVGIQIHVNMTYPGCGFSFPEATSPLHIVRIEGTWTEATFAFNHSLYCYEGSFAFGTDQPQYTVGDDVRLSIKNALVNGSLKFGPNYPLRFYRRLGGEWIPGEWKPSHEGNVTLEPGESFVWVWPTGDPTNGTELQEAGSYRLDLLVEHVGSWRFLLTAFFNLI